jgi:hypothetical protein
LVIMVSRRSRSSFAVLLAFALLPILTMASGGLDAGARAGMAWMQGQAKAQTPVQGLRAGLAEVAGHHADAIPFAPADGFRLALSVPPVVGHASAESIPSVTAPATLHPARAPPALS